MKSKENRLFTDKEQCSLDERTLNPDQSMIGLEEENKAFVATLNHLRFQKISEVVKSVLNANGFVINLENLLSSLDSMSLGIWAKVSDSSTSPAVVKTFNDCLQFKLPKKTVKGFLLQEFYNEIEKYEQTVLALEKSKKNLSSEEKQEFARLEKENDRLERLNAMLEKKIQDLTLKNQSLHLRYNPDSAANSEIIVLPNELRLGNVKSINLKNREVIVRAQRKNFCIPLKMFSFQPEPEQACIIWVEDQQIFGVFQYTHPLQPYEPRIGQVLHRVKDQKIKIRDSSRYTWTLTAANDEEKILIQSLRRDDYVTLTMMHDQVATFEKCDRSNPRFFQNVVKQKLSSHEVEEELKDTMMVTLAEAGNGG